MSNGNDFIDDHEYIIDVFILNIADKWNLHEYEDDPNHSMGIRLLRRENIYYHHTHANSIYINIVTLLNISNIVHNNIVNKGNWDASTFDISDNPDKYLEKQFCSDLNDYIKKIRTYFNNRKDDNDIDLNNHIDKLLSYKPSGGVLPLEDEDIYKFLNLSRKIKKNKCESYIRYYLLQGPYMSHNHILYDPETQRGKYKIEINIRFEIL